LAALDPAEGEILRRQAGLFITAVDPCVEYDIPLLYEFSVEEAAVTG
jgi:hypothetical protein